MRGPNLLDPPESGSFSEDATPSPEDTGTFFEAGDLASPLEWSTPQGSEF